MKAPGGGPDHPVVVAPLASRFLSLPAGVRLVEPEEGSPGATHPAGFAAAGVVAGLKESGRPDMGVLAVEPQWREQAASAAVFTTNAFAAAPIVLDRSVCDLGGLVAVVMNSANANACTGPDGIAVAEAMQAACAEVLGVPAAKVAVGSTGIIGRQADAAVMAMGAKKAAEALRPDGGPDFNQAIMTTDRFPKICALDVVIPGGAVRLGVCGKGAGMISPAMATMLCVVTTDAVLTAAEMGSLLDAAVCDSFNRVTVDGEMSTNDTVLFLSSGASGVRPDAAGLAKIAGALEAMLLRVALMMVADGEGATKIMRLKVEGADTEATAVAVARAIGDSPLVKTAMHGADANWGRIISSAGAALAGRSAPKAALWLCAVKVVENAAVCAVEPAFRDTLTAGMKQPEIDIRLDLGLGGCSTQLYFADLGHEYITINAEYHT
ncbi:MAG: bifunctional glutamate N-acetyltransferase/amino-acid acetyltransferase ArgJ [Thermoleophilia bacterium]|nr:bifunctional glutamate N-acetyltransferase/amino-acid acetyltransferase ArgJ [Thermoleophilia bacterium]